MVYWSKLYRNIYVGINVFMLFKLTRIQMESVYICRRQMLLSIFTIAALDRGELSLLLNVLV